jgi:predicted trehalose synthase
MLRSFDYAARTVAVQPGGPGLQPEAWLRKARRAFLDAYGPLSPMERGLLGAFEVEKACYEVHYEANNRPDWTWLPVEALVRLAS